jgi:hypothetical protein
MKKLFGYFLVLLLSMSFSVANAEWVVDTPENHGTSTVLLKNAADKVRKIGGRQGFVVIRDGVLIYEKYYYGNKDIPQILLFRLLNPLAPRSWA